MRDSKLTLFRCLSCVLCAASLLVLNGCSAFNASGGSSSGIAIQGKMYGGNQPVTHASVYLYAAGESGYGGNSISLLTSSVLTNNPSLSGKDSNGNYYVITDSYGNFSITGDWTCNSANPYIYLLGVGGSSNNNTPANANVNFSAVLGNCTNTTAANGPVINSSTVTWMNEVTTAATAYALSGFMTSPTAVSSNSTTASINGLAAAFLTYTNLVNNATGTAYTKTPGSASSTSAGIVGTASAANLNTLADILAACQNTTGGVNGDGSVCGNLFYYSTPSGGTAATNTLQAALNIVHNPSVDPGADLYGLISSTPPFQPYLSQSPYDWTLPIVFASTSMNNLYDIAIDGNNNVWAVSDGKQTTGTCSSATGSNVVEMTNLGVVKSGSNGFTSSSLACPFGITLDTSGNAWVTQDYAAMSYLIKITSTGTLTALTPTTGDGDYFNNAAFDASGNLWLTNYLGAYVSRYSSTGTWSKYSGGGISSGVGKESWGIAADGLGHMFIADYAATGKVSEVDATTGTAGTFVSSTGYTGSGMAYALRLAVDQGNHVWVANFGSSAAAASAGTTVSELSNAGAAMTGSPFSLGTCVDTTDTITYSYAPFGIAVDGGNHIWTADAGGYGVSELDDNGNVLSPSCGYLGTIPAASTNAMLYPEAVAIDEAGNVWVANYGYLSGSIEATITELVGAATPTLTPIAAATAAGTPAAKP
jgi:hypothetical protein